MPEEAKLLRVLSLGAGVQSSTMALMAAEGLFGESPSCAIFADTKHEPSEVYDWLSWLETKLPFPVHRVSRGDLWKSATRIRRTKDGLRTYVSTGIPVFMVDGLKKGIGKRQCTRDFKIDPINRKVRELLEMRRVPAKSPALVEMWIGISTDEALRMKDSRLPWIRARWPLIELGISRADCITWMTEQGHPTPPRSACTFCPYHSDKEWLRLSSADFADSVKKERELQMAYRNTTQIRGVPFFHASRKPLGEVMLSGGPQEVDQFNNDCEGMCGV
jgi:hypothetical protein